MIGRVVVTGGSGFLGSRLCKGLVEAGYDVESFDRLRPRRLGPIKGSPRLTGDDILAIRSTLTARFAGAHSVVHLAGIPHPYIPGVVDDDLRRVNLMGSINVFEAARDAQVSSFVFASSGQAYAINAVIPARFPLRESDPVPGLDRGANLYGLLKVEMELHLAAAARDRPSQTVSTALRLGYPGMKSTWANNFYVSTTLENLVSGVVSAIEAPRHTDGETFNLCDAWVGIDVVEIQRFLSERFPEVPNETIGNESPMSVDKLRDLLGWVPHRGGSYLR